MSVWSSGLAVAQHMSSNEEERANKDIYDDFKMKKPFSHNIFQRCNALVA